MTLLYLFSDLPYRLFPGQWPRPLKLQGFIWTGILRDQEVSRLLFPFSTTDSDLFLVHSLAQGDSDFRYTDEVIQQKRPWGGWERRLNRSTNEAMRHHGTRRREEIKPLLRIQWFSRDLFWQSCCCDLRGLKRSEMEVLAGSRARMVNKMAA